MSFETTGNSTASASIEVSFREIFLAVFYSTALIASFAGNSMVLAAVYKNTNKRMRSISNFFIVKMSVSDIVITLSHLPFVIYNLFETKWLVDGIYGHILCGIFKLLVYLSMDVSMLSLVVIAADRFWGVFYPTRQRLTTTIANKIIAVTWLISVASSLPLVTTARVERNRCLLEISSGAMSDYTTIYMTVFLFLPLVTMVVFYLSVGIKLRRRKIPGNITQANLQLRERFNRKITAMLVTISMLFVTCWIPYGTIHSLFILQNRYVPNNLFDVTSCFAYFNCALNPCIYFIFNKQFRSAFKDICRARCTCRSVQLNE